MDGYPDLMVHPADDGGCGWYRLVIPAHTLSTYESLVCVVTGLQKMDTLSMRLSGGRVAVVQRQTEQIQLNVAKSYRSAGMKVVHDLDDLLWEAPTYNAYRGMFSNERRQVLDWIMKNVDTLTASTVPIADAIHRRYRRRAHVIPNVLLPAVYRLPHARTNEKLRVGWAGSNTHSHDLERIEAAVRETKDKVQWVFLGYVTPKLEPHVEFHKPVKVREYVQALASLNLDVAIAPLDENQFNDCKSNLKMLEFGAIGLPVITSDVYPYRDNPGVKIKNSKKEWRQWIDAVLAYADNEPLRTQHATATFDYAQRFNCTSPEYRRILRAAWWDSTLKPENPPQQVAKPKPE